MSIVGTRPPLIGEVSEYELHHRARLAIKPGITGMWQVSGRSDITDFEEVVELDKEYIENWNMERQGDITIGDFWNIKNANETFEDKLGVSSVIINSEKGKKIFETVKNEFDIIECSLNDINQKNLNSPSPKPVHYEEFQRLIAEKGFEYCLKKYGSMKMLEKIRRALSPVKQRLKNMIRH